MMKYSAQLIGYTSPTLASLEGPEELIAYCARVSSGRPKEEWGVDYDGLLSYCQRNAHWSVFEMADVVIEVEAPRDISRQIIRHRSFCFQEFCVSADTIITTVGKSGRSKKVSISDLHKRYRSSYWKRSDNLVRVYDQDAKSLVSAKIREVFDTGVKDVFEVSLDGGKKIKCTEDHKLLTLQGFKRLSEIDVERDFIGVNGVPRHQNKEWLASAKKQSILTGTGVSGIAEMAGVSYHTIRKWLKKHDLVFTKLEVSSYTAIWNKGLPKEEQPCYGRVWSEEERENHSKSARKGERSNLYRSGNNEKRSWRLSVQDHCYRYKKELLIKQGYKCAMTGESVTESTSHVDHIVPVSMRPDLAFNKDNLQVLSVEAHAEKTKAEMDNAKKTATYKKINSVSYVGKEQTYDMEIEHVDHNYVANGIITHNSQRYSDKIEFTERDVRLQDTKNRQNSIDEMSAEDKAEFEADCRAMQQFSYDIYTKWLDRGAAKECTRVFLPEGLTMSRLMMKGSARSWLHYVGVRDDWGVTQQEHVMLAREIRKVLAPVLPVLFGQSD